MDNADLEEEDHLDYRVGDTVAVINLDEKGLPNLGILWDEARRIPGRYHLYARHMASRPLKPPTDWLDDKTQIFYFSMCIGGVF